MEETAVVAVAVTVERLINMPFRRAASKAATLRVKIMGFIQIFE
ncbi:MAG: hypothetical protein JWR68_23 [Polaromonas sp.]|nr:hypothetical protein [Polaromonas sp.]